MINKILSFSLVALLAFVWMLSNKNKDLRDEVNTLKGDIAAIKIANQQAEETNTLLLEERELFNKSLLMWKESYDAIQKENNNTVEEIRRLEAENVQIRDMLSRRVPNDLWRVLFPKAGAGNNNSNKGGKADGSSDLDTGNRGAK